MPLARAQFSYPLDERLNRQIDSVDTRYDETETGLCPTSGEAG